MLLTTRKPATADELLVEEFMQPMDVTRTSPAAVIRVPRKHVNELCEDRRDIAVSLALRA